MKTMINRVTVMLVGLGLSTQVAMGDGFRNPPEGAKALGKAGVKTVYVDDATAISHNPANLSDLAKPQLLISGTAAWSDQDYDSPAGSASTDDEFKFLPNVYSVWPTEKNGFVVGVGVTTPYGQSTVWEHDSLFRYSSPYFGEMKMVDINPTLAKRINDRLTVGVGVDIYWSELTIKQFLPWSLVIGAPGLPDGRARLEGDGTAIGANAGLAFKVTDKQTLGVTYRGGFDLEYEGNTRISNIPAGFPGAVSRSDFETEIEFPAILGVGYGVEVSEKLRVEAQVEWLEHSSYETLNIDAKENNLLLAPTSIPQNWDDTWTFGLGGDYQYTETCTLRAGYSYIESPIPDETYSPSIPDSDRHVIAVGCGLAKGDSFIDIAYAYSLLDDRDINNNQNPAYNGDYEYEAHLLSVSYGLNL